MCGKKYKTIGRYKLHLARGHDAGPTYSLSKDHLQELIAEISHKVAENGCYPTSIRSEFSAPFAKNLASILIFVEKRWKWIKRGKLEKFYSNFTANVMLSGENFFPTLSKPASMLILSKLREAIVVDFKRWSKGEEEGEKEFKLQENEIYPLQYIGGYVIHKLDNKLQRKKGVSEVQEFIRACQGDESDAKDSRMIAALNRGGLWYVNKTFQNILEKVELNFRKFIHIQRKIVNTDKFVVENIQDPVVKASVADLSMDIASSEENIKIALQLILELFVKVRMFSFARKKKEEAIEKLSAKKKGLRTELKRYENPLETEIPE